MLNFVKFIITCGLLCYAASGLWDKDIKHFSIFCLVIFFAAAQEIKDEIRRNINNK